MSERKPIGLSVPYRKAGVVIDRTAAKRIATTLGWEPKREWVGLTDEDRAECVRVTASSGSTMQLIAAIEAKLKEKNA